MALLQLKPPVTLQARRKLGDCNPVHFQGSGVYRYGVSLGPVHKVFPTNAVEMASVVEGESWPTV